MVKVCCVSFLPPLFNRSYLGFHERKHLFSLYVLCHKRGLSIFEESLFLEFGQSFKISRFLMGACRGPEKEKNWNQMTLCNLNSDKIVIRESRRRRKNRCKNSELACRDN